jgi:hypothetical protein
MLPFPIYHIQVGIVRKESKSSRGKHFFTYKENNKIKSHNPVRKMEAE